MTLTLMVQPARTGGIFEFYPSLRTADDENTEVSGATATEDAEWVSASLSAASALMT